jgi:hypothetical protein
LRGLEGGKNGDGQRIRVIEIYLQGESKMEFFQMATLVLLFVISCSTLATQINLQEIKKLLQKMNDKM